MYNSIHNLLKDMKKVKKSKLNPLSRNLTTNGANNQDGTHFNFKTIFSVLLCSISLFIFSCTEAMTEKKTDAPVLPVMFMIQDFESSAENDTSAVNSFNLTDDCYAYDGDTNQNGTNDSMVNQILFTVTTPGANATTKSVKLTYSIGDKDPADSSDGAAFSRYRTKIGGLDQIVDFSGYTGLSFYATGSGITKLSIKIKTEDQLAISQYADYNYSVTLTDSWQLYQIPWTYFVPPSWAPSTMPYFTTQLAKIKEIAFLVEESTGTQASGDFSLDEICAYYSINTTPVSTSVMIQNFESAAIADQNANPLNFYGLADKTTSYNGDNNSNGTNSVTNEITFAVTASGANSTAQSAKLTYNICDKDATEVSDGPAHTGYKTTIGGLDIIVDFSGFTGLSFYAKGNGITRMIVRIKTEDQIAVSDSAAYISLITLTDSWQLYQIPWTYFIPPSWAPAEIPDFNTQLAKIKEIAYLVEESDGIQTPGEFSLDEICTY